MKSAMTRSRLDPKSSCRMETRRTQKTRASKDDMETYCGDVLWREFVDALVVYDKKGSK